MQTDNCADETSQPPSWAESARVLAGLATLFLVIYMGTNWITSRRSDVGTWYYDWERHIPFVPAMIVPYASLDLFFVAAPFLCSQRRELRILTGRMGLAGVLAGLSFLLFPLTLAVDRPHVEGWGGTLFNWLWMIDLPYNLCPSLHITQQVILGNLFVRHTRGMIRWSFRLWFSLIGLSTLLTYQHHAVDVIGGLVLAAVCFCLVREKRSVV